VDPITLAFLGILAKTVGDQHANNVAASKVLAAWDRGLVEKGAVMRWCREVRIQCSIRGPLGTPDNMITVAARGEELGFDFVSVSDHVVYPIDIQSRYPYTESGAFSGSEAGAGRADDGGPGERAA